MEKAELKEVCTTIGEMHLVHKNTKDEVDRWIAKKGYSVDEIALYLDSRVIKKRGKNQLIGGLAEKKLIQSLNRDTVAFNYYFPEKAIGGINHKIAAFRLLAGIPQWKLAQMIGVERPRISEFENRVKFSHMEAFEKMLKVLDLTIARKV
jgi:DNA-binding XRE family transcriptional regulator